jgi:hypothetical protein
MTGISTADQLFRIVLIRGLLLIFLIGTLGSLLGYLVAGEQGVASGLVGSALALFFTSLTLLSVMLGRRLSLAGFFGVVMGGWLLKLIGFIFVIRWLQSADFINGPVLFFTLVAAILGSLVIDSIAVLRARIPVIES